MHVRRYFHIKLQLPVALQLTRWYSLFKTNNNASKGEGGVKRSNHLRFAIRNPTAVLFLFNLTYVCPSGILVNRRMSLFLAVLCLSVGRGLAGNAFYNMPYSVTICVTVLVVTVSFFFSPTTATGLLLDLRLNLTDFAYRLRRPLPRDEVCRSSAMPKVHESTRSLRCRPRCCLRHLCRNA